MSVMCVLCIFIINTHYLIIQNNFFINQEGNLLWKRWEDFSMSFEK